MTRPVEYEIDALQSDFERQLFESARDDGPRAGETERAWLKFAAAAGGVTAVGAGAALGARSWLHAAPLHVAKWVLIGALGGGSVVGVWLRSSAVPEPPRSAPLSAPVAAAAPVAVPAPAAASAP